MWLLVILFPATAFAIELDSPEQCELLWQINRPHWEATRQEPVGMCMKTFKV